MISGGALSAGPPVIGLGLAQFDKIKTDAMRTRYPHLLEKDIRQR